jgi:hypothetical protein
MNQVVEMKTTTIKADGPRTITRSDRRHIVDALEVHYDQDKQRYFKDMSDQKLGDKLNIPRVWITQIRVEMFGDHDRNEAQEADRVKALETIKLAESTRDKLLEMAGQAELILNDLRRKAGLV